MSWSFYKKKTTNQAGSSRSTTKNHLPLNDGSMRHSFFVSSTDKEWVEHFRTNAHIAVTEEEREELNDACDEYMSEPPYNPSPTYGKRFAIGRWNPSMLAKLKASVNGANEEITAIGVRWNKNRKIQLEKKNCIMEMKEVKAELDQEISREENAVKEIKEQYDVLEDKINENKDWII